MRPPGGSWRKAPVSQSSISMAPLQKVRAKISTLFRESRIIGLACNVADQDSCAKAVETVIAAFGQIDILINNAGVTQPVKLLDIKPAIGTASRTST